MSVGPEAKGFGVLFLPPAIQVLRAFAHIQLVIARVSSLASPRPTVAMKVGKATPGFSRWISLSRYHCVSWPVKFREQRRRQRQGGDLAPRVLVEHSVSEDQTGRCDRCVGNRPPAVLSAARWDASIGPGTTARSTPERPPWM